jgi:hypothetical protein
VEVVVESGLEAVVESGLEAVVESGLEVVGQVRCKVECMTKMRSVEGSLEDEVEVGNPGRTGVASSSRVGVASSRVGVASGR